MKEIQTFVGMTAVILSFLLANAVGQDVSPKQVLVVSTSTRNRFADSIKAAEKMLAHLSQQSHAFTLDFAHQPLAPQPKKPKPPAAIQPGASAEDQTKYAIATEEFKAAHTAYEVAAKKFDDARKEKN